MRDVILYSAKPLQVCCESVDTETLRRLAHLRSGWGAFGAEPDPDTQTPRVPLLLTVVSRKLPQEDEASCIVHLLGNAGHA
jgi:hypothetical protein